MTVSGEVGREEQGPRPDIPEVLSAQVEQLYRCAWRWAGESDRLHAAYDALEAGVGRHGLFGGLAESRGIHRMHEDFVGMLRQALHDGQRAQRRICDSLNEVADDFARTDEEAGAAFRGIDL